MQRFFRLLPKRSTSLLSALTVATMLLASSPAQATQPCIPEGSCALSPLAWLTGTFLLAPSTLASSALLVPLAIRNEHAGYWETAGWSALASVVTTGVVAGVGTALLNDGQEGTYMIMVGITPVITTMATALLYEGDAPTDGAQASAADETLSTIPWVSVAATEEYKGVSLGWQF